MDEITKDVDLEQLLKDTLKSEETESSVASDEKTVDEPEVTKTEEVIDESKEEPSLRAQDRIRKLVDENKNLKGEDLPYNSVDEFLAAIEDAPSRQLLETYNKLQQRETMSKLDPVLKDSQSKKFDEEVEALVEKLPELKAHLSDMKKTYMRNPSQSIRALASETVLDIVLSKVKPAETKTAQPARGNLEASMDMDKEDLYDLLGSLKPN